MWSVFFHLILSHVCSTFTSTILMSSCPGLSLNFFFFSFQKFFFFSTDVITPSPTFFIWYIHYLSSAPVQTILTSPLWLIFKLLHSTSDLHISNPVHPGHSKENSQHLHFCYLYLSKQWFCSKTGSIWTEPLSVNQTPQQDSTLLFIW